MNKGDTWTSINRTRLMLKMIKKEKTRIAALADTDPEEIGKFLLRRFSLSFSRSKYWFRTKIPAVAVMKEKDNNARRLIGGIANKMLPSAKLNSHPIQLSNLSIRK